MLRCVFCHEEDTIVRVVRETHSIEYSVYDDETEDVIRDYTDDEEYYRCSSCEEVANHLYDIAERSLPEEEDVAEEIEDDL